MFTLAFLLGALDAVTLPPLISIGELARGELREQTPHPRRPSVTYSSASNDIDVLGDSDGLPGLTYSQLGAGLIAVGASTAALGGVWVSEQSANRSLHFRGRVDRGLVHLRLWTNRSARISAGDDVLAPGQVLLAFPDQMLDVTVHGPSQSLAFTMEVDRLAAELGPEALDMAPATVRARRRFVDADPAVGGDRDYATRDKVFGLIRTLLRHAAVFTPFSHAPRAPSTVREVCEHLMARLAEPLTLQELCRVCSRSKRSLVAQFTDALGISPMAYFKLQRLNAARRALKAADPRASHVVDIAGNFGFYHMGHFAVDYHELFGVHPSVTLATMPRGVAAIDEGLVAASASSQGEHDC